MRNEECGTGNADNSASRTPNSAIDHLNEAQLIAERGPMPLYLADVHLHRARLFRNREELSIARELIDRHHYDRRREELDDAEKLLQ